MYNSRLCGYIFDRRSPDIAGPIGATVLFMFKKKNYIYTGMVAVVGDMQDFASWLIFWRGLDVVSIRLPLFAVTGQSGEGEAWNATRMSSVSGDYYPSRVIAPSWFTLGLTAESNSNDTSAAGDSDVDKLITKIYNRQYAMRILRGLISVWRRFWIKISWINIGSRIM